MQEFLDENGKKVVVLSEITLMGITYYITKERNVYIREDDKYKIVDLEANNILAELIELPESLDID